MGEKRNRKTNVGDATMVLKFCFWFESSIRAEQSKGLFVCLESGASALWLWTR
jgi:hypothetical protein